MLEVSCVPSETIDPEAMRSLLRPASGCLTYEERLEGRRRPDTALLIDILPHTKVRHLHGNGLPVSEHTSHAAPRG